MRRSMVISVSISVKDRINKTANSLLQSPTNAAHFLQRRTKHKHAKASRTKASNLGVIQNGCQRIAATDPRMKKSNNHPWIF